jgi:hypothetical protein
MIREQRDATGSRPFVVLCLPRSRSAWLSRFLTYGDWVCGHEELRHMRSLDDVRAWFSQPCIGTAETAGAPWWRMLERFAPGARVLVVRRPVAEVVESLMRLDGCTFDRERLSRHMEKLDRKLDQIKARVPGVLSVNFADLEQETVCAEVFEHCLGLPHDHGHWAKWNAQNVQCDMRAMMRYFEAYRPALEKLAQQAKQQTIAAMARRQSLDLSGVTFQAEPLDAWIRDGRPLFEEHLVQVGEAPGDWRCKNIPLMQRLENAGVLQIMTARCNGRMFGYLMTLITPSLASETTTSAFNTTFFASPDFPGLGLKLQRAALAALKERGVDEVFMQAGLRGSGERIASIYKRLGAENNGQMFRLEMTEA